VCAWLLDGDVVCAVSRCSSQHLPGRYPGAIKPWGLSQVWGGGLGRLCLLGQVGVETPVVQEEMSDNTPGTALPKAADISCFWKRIKGLGGGGGVWLGGL